MITNATAFSDQMQLKLQPESRARLRPELTTTQYFVELMRAGALADARRLLAHALPRRQALWWGCLCAWEAYRPQPPASALDILRTLTLYVQDPTDVRRRALRPLSRAAGLTTLAGNLASAGFLSAGSMSAPGLPEVPPPLFLTGRLVGVAVYLASVHRQPARYKDHLRQFLAMGLEVARGENLWHGAAPAASQLRVLVPGTVAAEGSLAGFSL